MGLVKKLSEKIMKKGLQITNLESLDKAVLILEPGLFQWIADLQEPTEQLLKMMQQSKM